MTQTRSPLAILCVFVSAAIFSLSWPIPAASAEETDVAALQSRIRQLEERVTELERLLTESQAARGAFEGDQTGWQNKKNWRRLSLGMREGEVKQILGNPTKVIHGVKTLWYYPNIYCGYLTFDEKGQLIGWSEP